MIGINKVPNVGLCPVGKSPTSVGIVGLLPLYVGAGFGGALALLGVTDLDRDWDRRIRVGGVGTLIPPSSSLSAVLLLLYFILVMYGVIQNVSYFQKVSNFCHI